jgi:sulfoxide reductase heme-binding subunit YedZ
VGVDLMVAVAVSSALRQRINPRTWRGIHWLAYGSWPVAMAHTFGMGTDAATLWLDAVGVLCTLSLAGALAWRITDHRRNRRQAEVARATTRAVPHRTVSAPAGRVPTVAAGRVGTSTTADAAVATTTVRLLERDRP